MAGVGKTREEMMEISKNTRFTSENQPANKGRKKNKVTELKDDNGLTTTDIRRVYGHMIAGKTQAELEELLKDKEADFFLRAMVKGILTDFAKGKTDTYDKIVEYAYGKPKQIIETRAVNTTLDINSLSEDEKKRILKEGEEIYRKELELKG